MNFKDECEGQGGEVVAKSLNEDIYEWTAECHFPDGEVQEIDLADTGFIGPQNTDTETLEKHLERRIVDCHQKYGYKVPTNYDLWIKGSYGRGEANPFRSDVDTSLIVRDEEQWVDDEDVNKCIFGPLVGTLGERHPTADILEKSNIPLHRIEGTMKPPWPTMDIYSSRNEQFLKGEVTKNDVNINDTFYDLRLQEFREFRELQ